MNQTNISNIKKSRRFLYVSLTIILIILGGLVGMGSGVLQYGVAAAQCMSAPVAATTFMAGYSYDLPGDPGYGPSPFNQYFCNEQEAQAAGFRHSVGR